MDQITELLLKKNWKVTTAESCTGGLIAGTLVDIPGISDFFSEGYITYSNEAKHRLIGVSEVTLEKYGAVSPQTAEEMARGVLKAAKADISIVSTGIAGPGGGTPEKPVGLVYLACATKYNVVVKKYQFCGSRRQVREQSVKKAIQLLHELLIQNEN